MVGKVNRKKQFVSRHERSEAPVSLDLSELLANDPRTPADWQETLNQISTLTSSSAQIKILQAQKKKLRALLVETSIPAEEKHVLLRSLLVLFLHPAYFPFHTTLEWISSTMQELRDEHPIAEIIASVSNELWPRIIPRDRQLAELKSLQQSNLFLSALIVLHRDFNWLPLDGPSGQLHLLPIVLFHVAALRVVLRQIAGDQPLLAAENIHTLGLGSELLRNLAVLLKQNLSALAAADSAAWRAALLELETAAAEALTLSQPSRDLLTTAGQCLGLALAVHWSAGAAPSFPAIFARVRGLLPALAAATTLADLPLPSPQPSPVLSTSAKCGLLRGFVQLAELPGAETASLALLLDEAAADFLLHSCSGGESQQQLFALFGLESWMKSCQPALLAILSVPSNPNPNTPDPSSVAEAEAVRFLRLARRAFPVLRASWAHPNRQVSHNPNCNPSTDPLPPRSPRWCPRSSRPSCAAPAPWPIPPTARPWPRSVARCGRSCWRS
jgi:hypothetical protein